MIGELLSAKGKIDATRRTRYETGGGPAPPNLTAADEALAISMSGKPGVHSIPAGIDTDGKCILM